MITLLVGIMMAITSSGLDVVPDVYFAGDISYGNFEYAVVRIYSCDSRPFECIYTSGNIAPGGAYNYLAYTDAGDANDNEFYIVECTRYDNHGQVIGMPSIVGNLYWMEDFEPSGGNDYYCTNDF